MELGAFGFPVWELLWSLPFTRKAHRLPVPVVWSLCSSHPFLVCPFSCSPDLLLLPTLVTFWILFHFMCPCHFPSLPFPTVWTFPFAIRFPFLAWLLFVRECKSRESQPALTSSLSNTTYLKKNYFLLVTPYVEGGITDLYVSES